MCKDRNAIITGAGRNNGIGAEICRSFAQAGINVYFTSYEDYDSTIGGIQKSDYKKTLNECLSFGVKAHYCSFDLKNASNIRALFTDAIEKIGSIDILVNCACYHCFDNIDNITDEILSDNLSLNSKSAILLSTEFYHRFIGTNGRIVNFTSTQNLEALINEISYAVSKSVVPVIVSTLAPVMASKGITINAVNPGATEIGDINDKSSALYLKNNMFGRLGTPQDSANIVSFLVSDAGKWITGQTINSEGGLFRGIINFET